jgi:hypothetical protein
MTNAPGAAKVFMQTLQRWFFFCVLVWIRMCLVLFDLDVNKRTLHHEITPNLQNVLRAQPLEADGALNLLLPGVDSHVGGPI